MSHFEKYYGKNILISIMREVLRSAVIFSLPYFVFLCVTYTHTHTHTHRLNVNIWLNIDWGWYIYTKLIYIYIYISLIYTLIHGGGRLYIFIICIMKIQCQNMLNNLMSLSVSSVVAIVFTKGSVYFILCCFWSASSPSVTWHRRKGEDMNVIMLIACTDCKLYCFCSILPLSL